MSTRARWIVFGVVALLALGSIALYWFNSNLTQATVEETAVVHRWVVQPGQTRTWEPDDVGPDDRYRCPGKGGVNGTPEPGKGVGGSGGFSVETALDGTVTAYCEPGPPGDY